MNSSNSLSLSVNPNCPPLEAIQKEMRRREALADREIAERGIEATRERCKALAGIAGVRKH